jgi:hypothetical protein
MPPACGAGRTLAARAVKRPVPTSLVATAARIDAVLMALARAPPPIRHGSPNTHLRRGFEMQRTFGVRPWGLRSLGVLAFATVIGLALAFASSARAGATQSSIPISGKQPADSCTGEVIDYSGTENLVSNVVANGSGGFHINVNLQQHVTGVGETSGTQYTLNGTFNTEFNVNGAAELTITLHEVFVAHGSQPNEAAAALLHITVNANGDVTVLVDKLTDDCRA